MLKMKLLIFTGLVCSLTAVIYCEDKDTKDDEEGKMVPASALVAVIIVALMAIVATVIITIFCYKKKMKQKINQPQQNGMTTVPMVQMSQMSYPQAGGAWANPGQPQVPVRPPMYSGADQMTSKY